MVEDLHFHNMFWIDGTVFSFGDGDLWDIIRVLCQFHRVCLDTL